jgi:hypothetical protein
MEIILSLLGALVLIPLLIIYSSFSWGYVASIIYSWFILPIFTNAPILTWVQLAGIMFLVNCFVHSDSSIHYMKKEVKNEYTGLTTSILSPWLTLFGAWIFKILIY